MLTSHLSSLLFFPFSFGLFSRKTSATHFREGREGESSQSEESRKRERGGKEREEEKREREEEKRERTKRERGRGTQRARQRETGRGADLRGARRMPLKGWRGKDDARCAGGVRRARPRRGSTCRARRSLNGPHIAWLTASGSFKVTHPPGPPRTRRRGRLRRAAP